MLALANQQSIANGAGTVGFINPALYTLATGPNYSSTLHDIVSGSNPPATGGGSGFNAVTGYDLVTGWGSPIGAALIDQLAGAAAPGATAAAVPTPSVAGAPNAPATALVRVFMYPARGQSVTQQATDRRDCGQWAATQMISATAKDATYLRAMTACGEARGYVVR